MKKIIIVLCLICFHKAYSQRDHVLNMPEFDQRYMHFGFSLGVASFDYFMQADHRKNPGDSILGIEVQRQPGFNINGIFEYHLGKYFGLRFTPGLSLGSRNIDYRFLSTNGLPKVVAQNIEATNIEFPLTFKFRSERMNNFATYFLLGGQYNWDLAAQKKTNNNNVSSSSIVIKTTPQNYGVNVGAGMDFFMEFYKFSLEFKYFIGLNNSFIQDNTIYSSPIDKLKSRVFLVSISFEG